MDSRLFEMSLNLGPPSEPWREQSSSGTTVDSHPFYFGLHPFIAVFVIEDVDPDPLCFSFFRNRLSGSPPVTLRIAHVRNIGVVVALVEAQTSQWVSP